MTSGASSALRSADQLWASVTSMKKYDVVLMACEGNDGPSEGRTAAQYAAVRGYADMGGRIFGSHYHNNWIRSEDGEPNAGYPQVVKFASGAHGLDNPVPFPLQIDTSFPKGVAFRDWLVAVGATPTPGTILDQGRRAHGGRGDPAPLAAVDLRPGHQPEPDQAGGRVLLVHDAGRQRQRLRPHGVQRRPRLAGRRHQRRRSLPHPLRHDLDRT